MKQINRVRQNRSSKDFACSRIDFSQPIHFSFNGKEYTGVLGDTIASALLANGIDVVGRSFKYGRPRGIVTAGSDEPNAILQLGNCEATQVPNVRATQQLIFEGLECHSTSGWPSTRFHLMGIFGALFARFLPPGFYYKTFMAPAKWWKYYEKWIRKGAGLGRSPNRADEDIYEVINQHADVLIVGAGAAGLSAALGASRMGARVILADEQNEFGGSLLSSNIKINDRCTRDWIDAVVAELINYESQGQLLLLKHATVNGYHDHNFLTIHERCTDHLKDKAAQNEVRQRYHRVRAKQVILATGALERPLVFANNDLPGCMLASAISTYINRYQVIPGNTLVVMTANDSGYIAAIDWHNAGRRVAAVVDTRKSHASELSKQVKALGITIIYQSAVIEARRKRLNSRVCSAVIMSMDSTGDAVKGVKKLFCVTL
ncbi:MAG: 2Fe-2S iron-sulfur cluster-binding protein [Enterobacterales bacterium]|nr:2Fe-2S iron-sulfur cluster-binding protein [Enterobacterales bacterium]